MKSFRTACELARKRTKPGRVRLHDLPSEHGSKLGENDIPLPQVGDLLGHRSILVAERYDSQVMANLKMAARTLYDRRPFETFKFERQALHGRINKFHALIHMPGWRNWQTHRT
jgi:integrase